jgi:competence protein ComEC
MRILVLAFVAGAYALQAAGRLPGWPGLLAALAAALALGLVRARVPRVGLLVLCGALAGYHYAAWRAQARLADELPRGWEGRDVALTGIVADLPQPTERGTRFILDVESVSTAGAHVPETLALTWYAESRNGVAPPKLVPGERRSMVVRLKRPRGLANPHTFDFEPWALERGIRATGYVRGGGAPVLSIAEGWPYRLHRWRSGIRDSMQQELGTSRLRGVLVALAIGDQDAIAPEDWDVFWRTGVGHLMSISGLHITMLAGLGFALVRFAWVRLPALALRVPARKAAVVAATIVALAYTLMTGFAVPAQRTFVMLATMAACVLFDRHGSPSRVLAAAALAVLLLDPWAVLSPGFWLSFGAVASIFYAMALRTGRAGHLASAVGEQVAVTLAMVPMVVALFQQVSLVSPLANAFAIPLVSLVVVPLAIAGAFLDLAPLLEAAHALMSWLMTPLEALAGLPEAMLESHAPAPWTVVVAVAGCAWLLAPRGVPMRSLGAIWLVPLFAVVPPAPAWGEAWVDVLDVGNGLAVVVRTATHALAYDAGPAWSDEADTGSRIVVPFLRGEGVARLDGLVVSHADDDHSGGAISIAAARDPPWLLSPLPRAHPLQVMFDDSRRCEAGLRWSWDGVEFTVLHPDAAIYDEVPGRRARKENDRSCVLRVASRSAAALLTGDLEARGEAEMLARGAAALRADALLVPHHGSKTSSTPAFLDAVAPSVVVDSVGYRNRFGHPHPSVAARYAGRGLTLRRTDREGALRIVLPAEFTSPARVEALMPQVPYWSERKAP